MNHILTEQAFAALAFAVCALWAWGWAWRRECVRLHRSFATLARSRACCRRAALLTLPSRLLPPPLLTLPSRTPILMHLV